MCTRPITLRVNGPDGPRSITVPCGKCAECLRTRQNDYMVRIYEELLHCSRACMLTLTYRNDTVPKMVSDGKEYLTVWKDDVQKWMKRFRTNFTRTFGFVPKFKYFLCSEYGPKTARPHYHCIFIGLSALECLGASSDWSTKFGHVVAKDISLDSQSLECSSRYVAKYACKGSYENPFVAEKKVLPTFRLFSKGLGSSYVDRLRSWHRCEHISASERITPSFTESFGIGYNPLTGEEVTYEVRHSAEFSNFYLDSILARKFVFLPGGFKYHMPRYYAEKIYKTPRKSPFGHVKPDGTVSGRTVISSSALSRALFYRAQDLRFFSDCDFIESHSENSVNPLKDLVCSQARSFVSRDYDAQQQHLRFYRKSLF